MRIHDADVLVTRIGEGPPGRNYVLVRLETGTGLVGWGDASLGRRELAVEGALEHHVLPELEGRDARRIEDVWQTLFRGTYWRGGPVLNSALSGVDMALWDLKGKRYGAPVYELLGGRTRDYAAVYQHCGSDTVRGIVENVEQARGRGIEHFRINLRTEPDQYLDEHRIVGATREVREAVGPEPELLIDVHGRATPVEAARIAEGIEDADPFFLEDPVRPEQPRAFEYLRSQSTTPLAMGELYATGWEMLPLIERDLVDFVRTDLAHVGGITAARKLAAIAEHHHVRTAFHGPSDISPVAHAATVHLDLSVPNFGVQELTEHERSFGPDVTDVFEGGHVLVEGTGGVAVPDAPGLGVEVDEDAARARAFERREDPHPRDPDGSVQDW